MDDWGRPPLSCQAVSRGRRAAAKEATARININKLLEAAGWRFAEEDGKPANVCLELHCKIKRGDLCDLVVTGPTGTNVNDFRAILVE